MVAAYASGVGVTWNIANVGPVADAVAGHYGIALATVGLFTAVLFAAEIVSMPVIGRLTVRFGAKSVGLLALGLCIVGNLLTLVGGGITIALILRFVVGLGVGLGFVGGTTYVQQMGGGSLAQGLFGGMSLAAGGIAVAVVPLYEDVLGWQAPFITGAIVGAVALLGILVGPSTRSTTGEQEHGFVRLLGDRNLLRFGAVHAASFGLAIVLSNWVVTLLTRRAGHDLETAGLIGSLILFVGVVARPGGGLYTHMRPAHTRTVVQLSLVLGGIGTAVLGMAPPTGVATLGAVLVGVAAGIPFGPCVAGLGRTFPRAPGTAFGAMNFYVQVMIMLGTPLMGLTFSLPGDGLLGFVAAAAFWLFAAVVTPGSELLLGAEAASQRISCPDSRATS